MRLLVNFYTATIITMVLFIVLAIFYELAAAVGAPLYIVRPVLGAVLVFVIALYAAAFIYVRRR